MAVRAIGKGVPTSPKKLRLVVEAVRGKRVEEALNILKYLPQPGAKYVAKVVKAAAANAENNLLWDPEGLRITSIAAEEGPKLKRLRARARGRAGRIMRRSSQVTVLVEQEG
ncbi:MAG: 50S ribosomal protein L22 [Chloroflexi bacterium]|nr:50S ribosomal protein L22 [Chloroflexota bacterium]